MLVYKIDKDGVIKVNGRLRDMAPVLDEIAPSLQILRKVLAEHEAAVDSPAIKQYRNEMIGSLTQAIGLTHTVAHQAQMLAKATEQASKHLSVLDDHFDIILRQRAQTGKQNRVAEPQKLEVA